MGIVVKSDIMLKDSIILLFCMLMLEILLINLEELGIEKLL